MYCRLFSSYQLNAHFLYSITIYICYIIIHNMFRAVTCSSSGGQIESAHNWHTVRLFTESDDTRGCNNTICPPEDEQGTARNMLRIIM